MHHFTKCRHDIYCYHRYMDSRHITVTHACMVSISLSYELPFILHVLLFHVIAVFLLYDYFPLLILIFPLLDTRAVDMRCVESHIYCFPLSCFMLSTELRSCYHVTCTMHYICSCYIVYFKYHKYNLGIGET